MANQQRAPRKVSSLHRRVKDFLGLLDPASQQGLLQLSQKVLALDYRTGCPELFSWLLIETG